MTEQEIMQTEFYKNWMTMGAEAQAYGSLSRDLEDLIRKLIRRIKSLRLRKLAVVNKALKDTKMEGPIDGTDIDSYIESMEDELEYLEKLRQKSLGRNLELINGTRKWAEENYNIKY